MIGEIFLIECHYFVKSDVDSRILCFVAPEILGIGSIFFLVGKIIEIFLMGGSDVKF